MNSWRPYPLLRLVFPFLAGIISECVFGSTAGAVLWLRASLVFLLLLAQIIPVFSGSYRLRWVTGLLFNLFVFFAGYEIACIRRPANDPGYLGKCPDGLFVAAVAEPPTLSASAIKAILKVQYRMGNSCWVRSQGSAVGYLKSKPGARLPCFGDQILIRA